ncbi:hypothetical protein V500_03402 [Pseudogymnoascus sp. VKM F-4518 (FW-2643)]|nr:hypothetical protein V500_03402 [Pseudogymnoascus sp. VKM F-4518 (FW-2643)]
MRKPRYTLRMAAVVKLAVIQYQTYHLLVGAAARLLLEAGDVAIKSSLAEGHEAFAQLLIAKAMGVKLQRKEMKRYVTFDLLWFERSRPLAFLAASVISPRIITTLPSTLGRRVFSRSTREPTDGVPQDMCLAL